MLRWIPQMHPLARIKCDTCVHTIPPAMVYWRACANEDGIDERGYNCCYICRAFYNVATLNGQPPTRETVVKS